MRRRLPSLLAEVGQLLETDWPDYAKVVQRSEPEVEEAASQFVRRLVQMAASGLSHHPQAQDGDPSMETVFAQVGRMQWISGRELPELLTAYQVGAQAAWRHVSHTALELGFSSRVLTALAEAVFLFVHQLSAASASGYVEEQSESSAARERLREDLARLLLSDRSSDAEIRIAAHRVDWPLPELARLVLVDPEDEHARAIVDRLGNQALPIHTEQLYGCILPIFDRLAAPPRNRQIRGAHAVVGAITRLDQLPFSAWLARTALSLSHRGLLTDDPIHVADHLDTLLIHRDERLLDALRRQLLAPLDGLADPVRQRLLETLTAWLRLMGDRKAMAEELHIHPQTVRYRLAQLHDVLGNGLDDPDYRSRLFLALVWA